MTPGGENGKRYNFGSMGPKNLKLGTRLELYGLYLGYAALGDGTVFHGTVVQYVFCSAVPVPLGTFANAQVSISVLSKPFCIPNFK